MSRRYHNKENRISKEIEDLQMLNETLAAKRIKFERFLEALQTLPLSADLNKDAYLFELTEDFLNAVKTGSIIFREAPLIMQSAPTALTIKIAKLRKLLSSIKSASLSRTIMDYKSVFRTKVQFLFKNLDDAHITNFLIAALNLKNSNKHKHNPQWKKTTYNQHYELLTSYQ